MPTYTPNIPQPGDLPSQSQNLILENFQVINTDFGIDHVAFNATGEGKHKQITFPVHAPALTYLATEIGLQNLNQAPTNVPDIWLTRGTGTAFPATGYSIDGSGKSGWTYYPSGCLYAWGYATVVAATPLTITYTSADTSGGAGVNFPGFATMGNPQISFVGAVPSSINTTAYTSTTFTVLSSVSGTIIWHAIGI